MGKIFLASAAILALTCQSHAGDGKVGWAGSYLGIEAGAGFSVPGLSVASDASGGDFHDSGFIGGVYAGHDWQQGRIVYGVSANVDWLDFEDQSHDYLFGGKTDTYGYDLDWVAAVRGRVGYLATDDLLLYGTGGVAVTQVRASSERDGFFDSFDHVTATRVGGVVGGGLEYAFTPNWSVKTEYVHYFFDTVNVGGGDSGTTRAGFHPSFGTLNVGLSYHF
jgi:opacity protein-like surface antigen